MYWLTNYNKIFIPLYNKIQKMRKTCNDENLLCSEYINLFNCACELIKQYLNYNGLFQFENREVIKEAIYVELLCDGERWINALSLAEVYEGDGKEKFNSLILSYLSDENFYIYDVLVKTFNKIKEEYE